MRALLARASWNGGSLKPHGKPLASLGRINDIVDLGLGSASQHAAALVDCCHLFLEELFAFGLVFKCCEFLANASSTSPSTPITPNSPVGQATEKNASLKLPQPLPVRQGHSTFSL